MRRLTPVAIALALSAMASSEATGADTATEIRQWISAYDRALLAKDLERLAAFYHPDVTVFEGGSDMSSRRRPAVSSPPQK